MDSPGTSQKELYLNLEANNSKLCDVAGSFGKEMNSRKPLLCEAACHVCPGPANRTAQPSTIQLCLLPEAACGQWAEGAEAALTGQGEARRLALTDPSSPKCQAEPTCSTAKGRQMRRVGGRHVAPCPLPAQPGFTGKHRAGTQGPGPANALLSSS